MNYVDLILFHRHVKISVGGKQNRRKVKRKSCWPRQLKNGRLFNSVEGIFASKFEYILLIWNCTIIHICHLQRHDCSICNKTFANESLLSVHFQLVHELATTHNATADDHSGDAPTYPCDKCDRMFKNPSSVLYHKNSEHNHFRFVCSKCGKSFKHKQLLRRHQLVHSQDRKFGVSNFGWMWKKLSSLIYTGPYSCTTCGASFKTKPNLLNHLPIHNPVKIHNCTICKQSFAHKTR